MSTMYVSTFAGVSGSFSFMAGLGTYATFGFVRNLKAFTNDVLIGTNYYPATDGNIFAITVSTGQVYSIIGGLSRSPGDSGIGTYSEFDFPYAIELTTRGKSSQALYIADNNEHVIRVATWTSKPKSKTKVKKTKTSKL